jgi:flagellum-specific ATP synthase
VIPDTDRAQIWLSQLKPYAKKLAETPELIVEGKLFRMVGLTLEAVGCRAAIGSRCRIDADRRVAWTGT